MALFSASASAQTFDNRALTITNDPVPDSIKERVYSSPVQTRDIRPSDLQGTQFFEPVETLISRKVKDLSQELFSLRNNVERMSERLVNLERQGEEKAAEYYSLVATVNTQLRAGSTPGNPRLQRKVEQAQNILETLSSHVARMSQMSIEASNTASTASFLLETTRSTYNLSGAVEEDHIRLAELEDAISNTVVVIDRILNNISDNITRSSAYLTAERQNLRTLSLAVSNGDLYGKNLSRRPFSAAPPFAGASPSQAAAIAPSANTSDQAPAPQANASLRPLVKIRFDRPDVNYEQPIYIAVNEALARFPDANFELVAVQPTQGNPAQVALESTKARRNAERVLRSLTQMGMPLERIALSYQDNAESRINEVHLYIR